MKPKTKLSDLTIFGGKPISPEPLHVGRPNIGNRQRLMQRLNDILDQKWLTNNGPYVQEFEHKIAKFVGVKHCIAVCNATVGLQIAIRALGLGGEVILPSMTFIATAHALQWQGIKLNFCDIDPENWNISPDLIPQMITPRTRAILGVHLFGRPCNIHELEKIANKYKLKLLFDAAHAFGNSYNGQMIGGFGNVEVFSFHATKFINSLEGGAIVTNDSDLATKMKLIRNFGFSGYDKVNCLGINGKMNEFSAAMGITSLESMNDIVVTNHRNYNQCREELAKLPGVKVINYDEKNKCNFQYLVLEIDQNLTKISRDRLVKILWAENIMARRYFYPGCHRMEPYASEDHSLVHRLPITEKISNSLLSLPTGMDMNYEKTGAICQLIKFCVMNGSEIEDRFVELETNDNYQGIEHDLLASNLTVAEA